MHLVILDFFKNYLIKKSINCKYNSFFASNYILKLFTKKFYIYFNKYSNFLVNNKNLIKNINQFYLKFLNFFIRYIYFITKSKTLINLLRNSRSLYFKKILNTKVKNKLYFKISKNNLFFFFKFLRNNLLNCSLVNISLKQKSLFNLYFNIFYDKKLFM